MVSANFFNTSVYYKSDLFLKFVVLGVIGVIIKFESPEFFDEVSNRFGKVVINTHILQSGFQFVRLPVDKVQGTGVFLLYKDVVDGVHSLWLGYEVLDEEKLEINFGKPLWLHIESSHENRIAKVKEVNVIYMTDLIGLKSHNEVPINYVDTNGSLELTKRCLYNITKNIVDLYSKSRIISYIKVITSFVNFKYDFSKSELFSTDKDLAANKELCLKSRYMPMRLKNNTQDADGVSVFIDNLKVGRVNFAVWYCAPLKQNKLDCVNGFLSLAESNKSLNVNNILSDEFDAKFCAYDIFNDFVVGEKIVLNDKVQLWLSDTLHALKIKNIDVDGEIIKTFGKLEKQKDLFLEDILKNISFYNLEYSTNTPILTIPNDLIDLSDVTEIETPAPDLKQELEVENVDQSSSENLHIGEELGSKKIIPLLEEFIEGYKYKINKKTVELSVDGFGFKLEYDRELIEQSPNKVFWELIKMRVDPFTLLQMFKDMGIRFNQYTYSDVKEKIAKASDEELESYCGFENYLGLVRIELIRRKNPKIVVINS